MKMRSLDEFMVCQFRAPAPMPVRRSGSIIFSAADMPVGSDVRIPCGIPANWGRYLLLRSRSRVLAHQHERFDFVNPEKIFWQCVDQLHCPDFSRAERPRENDILQSRLAQGRIKGTNECPVGIPE